MPGKNQYVCWLKSAADDELLTAFVDKDCQQAFAEIVNRYVNAIFKTCMRRLFYNKHDADDATQAVFIILAEQAGTIRSRATLAFWLHRTACRVTTNMKRQFSRESQRRAFVTESNVSEPTISPATRNIDIAPHIDAAIGSLPRRVRDAVLLVCVYEMSYTEAASMLAISENAVLKRVHRGKEKLRSMLRKRGIDSVRGVPLFSHFHDSYHAAHGLVTRCIERAPLAFLNQPVGVLTTETLIAPTTATFTFKVALAATVVAVAIATALYQQTKGHTGPDMRTVAKDRSERSGIAKQSSPEPRPQQHTVRGTPNDGLESIPTTSGGMILFSSQYPPSGVELYTYQKSRAYHSLGYSDENHPFRKTVPALTTIRFPRIEFSNVLATEALATVESLSRRLDSTGQGVKLIRHRSIAFDRVSTLTTMQKVNCDLPTLLTDIANTVGAQLEAIAPRTVIIRKFQVSKLLDSRESEYEYGRDVLLQVHNPSEKPLTFTSMMLGSTGQRAAKSMPDLQIVVAPNSTTTWLELGARIDPLGDGECVVHGSELYQVSIGVRDTDGNIAIKETFRALGGTSVRFGEQYKLQ